MIRFIPRPIIRFAGDLARHLRLKCKTCPHNGAFGSDDWECGCIRRFEVEWSNARSRARHARTDGPRLAKKERQAVISHVVDQPIVKIVWADERGNDLVFAIGENGVTRIEACEKAAEYCYVPYIRVWGCDDECFAEISQHNLRGLFFGRRLSQSNAKETT